MAKLIKMVNDDGKKADVHPKMKDEYIKGGYVEAAGEKAETKEIESTTPNRCQAKTSSGKQCGNDALENSDFCHIKSHK